MYIYIYVYIYIYIDTNFTKILPVLHIFSTTIITHLKKLIGIKSPNTKQCPATLFLHPVKLSGFIEAKVFPQKRTDLFMIAAYLCVCKSKELYIF